LRRIFSHRATNAFCLGIAFQLAHLNELSKDQAAFKGILPILKKRPAEGRKMEWPN